MENMGSIDGIILSSHFLCNSVDKGFLSSFHPWSTSRWNSSWLPWLPGYLMMVEWYGLTQNLCLWPTYIYLLRTMRGHTLQTDFLARNSPSQWWLWGLRHHNVPLCPSTWVSGCWRRPWYTFSPLTPLCDSGEWLFRGMVFLLMTLRLSFSALYSLAYMSPFNTPASSILVWTSTKHFVLQICSSESVSHFIFWTPSSKWGFLRGLRNLRAST